VLSNPAAGPQPFYGSRLLSAGSKPLHFRGHNGEEGGGGDGGVSGFFCQPGFPPGSANPSFGFVNKGPSQCSLFFVLTTVGIKFKHCF